jgi:hypothetical protein
MSAHLLSDTTVVQRSTSTLKTEKERGFHPGVQCKSLTLRLWNLPQ